MHGFLFLCSVFLIIANTSAISNFRMVSAERSWYQSQAFVATLGFLALIFLALAVAAIVFAIYLRSNYAKHLKGTAANVQGDMSFNEL